MSWNTRFEVEQSSYSYQEMSMTQWRLTQSAHITCALLCMFWRSTFVGVMTWTLGTKCVIVRRQQSAVSLHCGMCPVNPTQPYLLSGCMWSLSARLQLTISSYPRRIISQLQNKKKSLHNFLWVINKTISTRQETFHVVNKSQALSRKHFL